MRNDCLMCQTEYEYLFDIFNPDYSSVLFRVCHECNIKAFLCPTRLKLRDRVEEYVNGYCIYEMKYMTELLNNKDIIIGRKDKSPRIEQLES